MRIQVISGIGALIMILSAFSIGLLYLDNGSWPPLSDPRSILVVFGLLALIVASAPAQRELAVSRLTETPNNNWACRTLAVG
jgi:hypothetical protein